MKQLIKLGIITLVMISTSAYADPADVNLSKESLHVDFNKMIDEGHQAKAKIQKHLDQAITEISEEEDLERSRVLDFVDVEIGWGDTPNTIVDRRFNSVELSSETPIYTIDLDKLVPNILDFKI